MHRYSHNGNIMAAVEVDMIYRLSRGSHPWHSGQYGAALLVKALSFHWSYQALRLPRAE